MPILDSWKISLTADDILRAQGADPPVVRQRRPAMADIAEWAVQESLALLQPQVLYQEFTVLSILHERLYLGNGQPTLAHLYISGALVAEHLRGAGRVIAMLCTIGEQLENIASELGSEDLLRSLAMDAAGSAAAEVLATTASHHFETWAANQGLQSSLPLNPGMIGWPVPDGQAQIFKLLAGEQERYPGFPVLLRESYMMHPRKTVSLVLGVGKDLSSAGKICDYCNMRETCRYQDHYH